MERPGVRRDDFIGAGSYLADTGVALERLGLFLDGCSSAAAAALPETEEKVESRNRIAIFELRTDRG